jgi:hypothetical protein
LKYDNFINDNNHDDDDDDGAKNNKNNSMIKLNDDVPYGAMKGGTKPSYRQFYNKTLKKNSFDNNNIYNYNNENKNTNHLKKTSHNKVKKYKPQPRKLKQVRRKTTIKKYKLGKHGNKISILIKNNKTRKIIQNAQRELKNVPIYDVKNALIKNNLLKLGSTAPSNILRKIYEECNMTGEVVNTNGDVFIHNYINETRKI